MLISFHRVILVTVHILRRLVMVRWRNDDGAKIRWRLSDALSRHRYRAIDFFPKCTVWWKWRSYQRIIMSSSSHHCAITSLDIIAPCAIVVVPSSHRPIDRELDGAIASAILNNMTISEINIFYLHGCVSSLPLLNMIGAVIKQKYIAYMIDNFSLVCINSWRLEWRSLLYLTGIEQIYFYLLLKCVCISTLVFAWNVTLKRSQLFVYDSQSPKNLPENDL